MTFEEALRLLDGHRGKEVTAIVETALGDWVTAVVATTGTLTPMMPPVGRSPAVPAPSVGAPSDLYSVGESSWYLPAGAIAHVRQSIAGPGIELILAASTSIRVAWDENRPESPRPRA